MIAATLLSKLEGAWQFAISELPGNWPGEREMPVDNDARLRAVFALTFLARTYRPVDLSRQISRSCSFEYWKTPSDLEFLKQLKKESGREHEREKFKPSAECANKKVECCEEARFLICFVWLPWENNVQGM